jgi:hypothetical protein
VQGGVEQCRVQAEVFRVGAVGQGGFGVDVGAGLPGGFQTAEHRAIVQPGLGHPVVEPSEVNGFGAGGWPLVGVEGFDRRAGTESSGGVPGPGGSGSCLGVHGNRAATVVGRRANHYLQRDPAAARQDQRSLESEVPQDIAADLVAGPDRKLDETRAGEENRVADAVVGQPRLGRYREPAGEHQAFRVRRRDQRT